MTRKRTCRNCLSYVFGVGRDAIRKFVFDVAVDGALRVCPGQCIAGGWAVVQF